MQFSPGRKQRRSGRRSCAGSRAAAVLLCAALAVPLGACSLLPKEEEPPAPPVIRAYEAEDYTYAEVQRGDVTETLRVSCSYTPAKKETLAFAESGVQISAVYVDNGDTVAEGELLAELDRSGIASELDRASYELETLELERRHLAEDWNFESRGYDLRIASAKEAGLTDLQSRLTKQKQTASSSYTSRKEIYNIRISTLEDKIAELQALDESRQLRAPFAGTVTSVRASAEGSMSVSGEAFVTISDKSTSVFTMSGKGSEYLHVGDTVELTISSTVYPATVIDPAKYGVEAQPNSRYIELDEYMPDLKDNASASLTFVVKERKNVLWVTSAAVKSANGASFVYTMSEDGIRTIRYFEAGFSANSRVEVLSGLEEGEQVIVQ